MAVRAEHTSRNAAGPLLGMAVTVGLALLIFLWFLGRSVDTETTIESGPDATTVGPAGDTTGAPAETSPLPEGSLPRE